MNSQEAVTAPEYEFHDAEMMLNKDRAARAGNGASEKFNELFELCQGREETNQMGSREVFLQQLLSSKFCRGTKKTHPKINWNVNPLNFQGIISILSPGSVSLVFVKSSSTIFRDKEQSLNDQCRKKNPFRAGKMSTQINFRGNDKDCPELSELQDQTLCTDPGLPFLCHKETKPPAKH